MNEKLHLKRRGTHRVVIDTNPSTMQSQCSPERGTVGNIQIHIRNKLWAFSIDLGFPAGWEAVKLTGLAWGKRARSNTGKKEFFG